MRNFSQGQVLFWHLEGYVDDECLVLKSQSGEALDQAIDVLLELLFDTFQKLHLEINTAPQKSWKKKVSEIEDFGSLVTDLEGMRCREIDFNLMGCYVVS